MLRAIIIATGVCVFGVLPGSSQTLEIWEIQGSGMSSPHQGQRVATVNNVVTAVGDDAFFLQCPDLRTDEDPWTSDGIFVATGASPGVEIGDLVDVTGTVRESFGQTELGGDLQVTLISSGHALPTVIDFDSVTPTPSQPWPETELERFEGMFVQVRRGTVSEPSDSHGEVCVSASAARLFREPGILYPGISGLAVWDGNPEGFELDPYGLGGAGVELSSGSTFSAVGVLAYAYGAYQLWPTALEITSEPGLPRPVRPRVFGEASVATQNLFRLGDPEDRVPYQTRLQKLSRQVRLVLGAPDVVAVQEVYDLETLEDLADRMTADDPAIFYTAYLIEGNDYGGIDVGYLVKDTVTVAEIEQVGASERFTWDGTLLFDRPPLVARVGLPGPGAELDMTLVAVHLKSLGGIDDPSDGDRVRQKRYEQSVWLSEWIQDRQEADSHEPLIVLGDFNAFEFSDGFVDVTGQITGLPDPDGALIAAGEVVDPVLRDWVLSLPAGERYSFIYACAAEVLDHVVSNRAASAWVRGVAYSRGNTDSPNDLESDASTALRSSDHDGMVVFLGPRTRSGSAVRLVPEPWAQNRSPMAR